MEKKFKFSENPKAQRSLYAIIVAVLCISAIIVGIVAANNRKPEEPLVENPPVSDGTGEGTGEGTGDGTGDGTGEGTGEEAKKQTFISPISGTVIKSHSLTIPVFSQTLEAWKIHTGIDISSTEGAAVFAASDGTVTAVRNDAMLGKTVEITHEGGIVTVYQNLAEDGIVSVGKKVLQGERIGSVGDSAISELADEVHLHFAMFVDGKAVDPLAYITKESHDSSLKVEFGEAS